MFKCFVVVCGIINANNCFQLEDTQDIYKTEEQCIERAIEIARQVPYYYKDFRATKYKCKKLAKGRLI
tara:strand:+ start:31 stop:234 length:204 start_codon:yes stop_codon:yes gene_type:complete